MNAKYFTRMLPIQFYNSKNRLLGKQVCIIPFKKEALIKYIKLKPTLENSKTDLKYRQKLDW